MRVVVSKHGHELEELILEKETVRVGCLETSDVVIEADGVKRFHAFIEAVPRGFAVTNIGTGKTFVNGEPVERATIPSGGSFEVGGFTLSVFETGELEILEQKDATTPEHPLWEASEEELSAVPATGEINVASEFAKLQREVARDERRQLWSASDKELSEALPTGEVNVASELAKLQKEVPDDDPHKSFATAKWTASEEEMSQVPATGEIDVAAEFAQLQKKS